MRSIIICDDDLNLCECLRSYAERMLLERSEAMRLVTYNSAEELLAQPPTDADILLLDIKLGGTSGLEAARILRRQQNNVCIIFVTSMTQFAIEGYEVHAFGFLKKPMEYNRFRHVVCDALDAIDARQEQYLSIRSGFDYYKVNAADIIYIEAQGHNVRVVTSCRTISTGMTLGQFEKLLDEREFFRCHKGFLIGLWQIRKIGQTEVVMSNEERIPISKYRRKEFLECFARFEGTRV